VTCTLNALLDDWPAIMDEDGVRPEKVHKRLPSALSEAVKNHSRTKTMKPALDTKCTRIFADYVNSRREGLTKFLHTLPSKAPGLSGITQSASANIQQGMLQTDKRPTPTALTRTGKAPPQAGEAGDLTCGDDADTNLVLDTGCKLSHDLSATNSTAVQPEQIASDAESESSGSAGGTWEAPPQAGATSPTSSDRAYTLPSIVPGVNGNTQSASANIQQDMSQTDNRTTPSAPTTTGKAPPQAGEAGDITCGNDTDTSLFLDKLCTLAHDLSATNSTGGQPEQKASDPESAASGSAGGTWKIPPQESATSSTSSNRATKSALGVKTTLELRTSTKRTYDTGPGASDETSIADDAAKREHISSAVPLILVDTVDCAKVSTLWEEHGLGSGWVDLLVFDLSARTTADEIGFIVLEAALKGQERDETGQTRVLLLETAVKQCNNDTGTSIAEAIEEARKGFIEVSSPSSLSGRCPLRAVCVEDASPVHLLTH